MDKDDQLLDIAEAALVIHDLVMKSGTPVMQQISTMLLVEIGRTLSADNFLDQSDTIAREVSAGKPNLRLLD